MKSQKFDPATLPLTAYEIAPERILAGSPTVALAGFWATRDGVNGAAVWEMTPGTIRMNPAHEMFTLVAGHATIELDNGQVFDVRAGDTVNFSAKDVSTWTVHETVRKVVVQEIPRPAAPVGTEG